MSMEVKTKIKKVAIYSRKSRPDETEDAHRRQLQVLIDRAVQNNWKWDVFQEIGSSMSMDEQERPKLNQLLRKVQAYEYDGVLVTDADRLSRDMEHSAYIKKMFAHYGVKLITTTRVYDYSIQEDDLMSDMMSVLAKQEYVNTKKRLMRGRKASAKEGKWQGKPPLGYKLDRDTKKLMIDEAEASIVKAIFKRYIDGSSSREIAQELNLAGVLTPMGKHYVPSRIGRILRNEVYKGDAIFGKTACSKIEKYKNGLPKQLPTDKSDQVKVEKAHPSIVSDEDWEKAKRIRNVRSKQPVASRMAKNKFSTLIACSICQRTVTFQLDQQGRMTMGSCKTRNYAADGSYTTCPNQGLLMSLFEEAFEKQLTTFIERLEGELEGRTPHLNEADDCDFENEITQLSQKIQKIDEKLKKVQQAFLAAILDEKEAKEEMSKLKNQKKELERKVASIENTLIANKVGALADVISDLKGILSKTTDLQVKEINERFKRVIDTIEYTRIGKVKGSQKAPFSMNIKYKLSFKSDPFK